ncbi:MAG: dihydroneopterin aldolase [Proteiniphilum sp.]|jgi:dihydroneopterin aldolase|nr:dihydroneopterin aldolase [Proteiniphilum sp.]
MKTKLKLKKMYFHARHGILPHERETGNDFEVSLTLTADLTAACQSDKLEDTINYADTYNLVKEEMETPSGLIEHVACRILRKIKTHHPQLTAVKVKVAKLHPPTDGRMERAEVTVTA